MKLKTCVALSPILIVLASGCSKATSASGSGLDNVPAVAPIVDSALPSTLKAGTSLSSKVFSFFRLDSAQASASTDILADLQIIFKSTYNSISGGSYTGYMNSLLSDLDSRMSGLKTMASGKTASCMNNASQVYTIDLSTHVDPAMKLSLDLQCSSSFTSGSSVAAAGSGMTWGANANGDYSLWLTLNHNGGGGDGFGYAAKVSNPTLATKSVDMLFIEAGSQNTRGSVARLKATPATNSYELLYASTASNAISPVSAGGSAHMGCQFQMISDGTLIYVKGNYVTGGACSSGTVENGCFNASDLSVNSTSGACNALKASFTISNTPDNFTHSEIDGITPSSSEETLYNAIQQTNAASVTTSFSPQ